MKCFFFFLTMQESRRTRVENKNMHRLLWEHRGMKSSFQNTRMHMSVTHVSHTHKTHRACWGRGQGWGRGERLGVYGSIKGIYWDGYVWGIRIKGVGTPFSLSIQTYFHGTVEGANTVSATTFPCTQPGRGRLRKRGNRVTECCRVGFAERWEIWLAEASVLSCARDNRTRWDQKKQRKNLKLPHGQGTLYSQCPDISGWRISMNPYKDHSQSVKRAYRISLLNGRITESILLA
jgi:hypothetical protein